MPTHRRRRSGPHRALRRGSECRACRSARGHRRPVSSGDGSCVADEGLVEDELRLFEAGFEVPNRPLSVCCRAGSGPLWRRQNPRGHLQLCTFRPPRAAASPRLAGWAWAPAPAAPQTLPWVRRWDFRPQLSIGSGVKGNGSYRSRSPRSRSRGSPRPPPPRPAPLTDVERIVGQAALAERARDDALAEGGAFDNGRQNRRPSVSPSRRHRRGRARVDRITCRGIGLRRAANSLPSTRKSSAFSPSRPPWRPDPVSCSSGHESVCLVSAS